MPPKKVPRVSGPAKPLRTRTKNRNVADKNNPEMKIAIPLQYVPNNVNNTARDVIPMLGKKDMKIMLANEVVRRQFPKKKMIIEEPTEITSTNKAKIKKTVVKKKPVLKKKKEIIKKDKVSNKISVEPPVKNKRRAVAKKNTIIIESVQCNDAILEKSTEITQDTDREESKKPTPIKRKRTFKKPLSVVTGAKKTNEKNRQVTSNTISKHELPPNRKIAKKPGPKPRKKATVETIQKQIVPEEPKVDTDDSNICKKKNLLNTRRCSTASSELSWTKDISSSSTSTCVTVSSKDFFRIDNKIPVIKLTDIDQGKKSDDNNVGDSVIDDNIKKNTNSDLPPVNVTNVVNDTTDVVNGTDFVSHNMSSSSSESSSDEEEEPQNVQNTSIGMTALEKLGSKLKNFDLEIINWIGYTDENANSDIKIFQDKLFSENFLYEERDVIFHCQNITKLLSDHTSNIDESENENCEMQHESNVNLDNAVNNNSHKSKDIVENLKDQEREANHSEDKPVHNNAYIDEDDALSLYAESITDMESPRNCAQKSKEHNLDEYIPLPIKDVFKKPEKITYKPTKIKKLQVNDSENVNEMVCEKSNADSTSMYRENNDITPEMKNLNKANLDHTDSSLGTSYENRSEVEKSKPLTSKESILMSTCDDQNVLKRSIPNSVQNDSIIMGSSLKPRNGLYSIIFKGVCYFNLISTCKNVICRFPHKYFDKEFIKERLKTINDQDFQREFVLLRISPTLRWLYGMCFIEDCVRRKLTRVLFEMTLDFVTRANSNSNQDKLLAIDVIEITLLYLNNVDFSSCIDLLKYTVKPNTLLCDTFMDTIAKSQNFAQFKTVFINLTNFMYDFGRTFHSDVANNVLERVCILPYDDLLARALLKLIKNTDISVITNPMMSSFEQQLSFSNKELYAEFCLFKEECSKNIKATHCYESPLNESERISSNSGYSETDIRYSPDTTNRLDSVNKVPVDPKFTRTIDLNKLRLFNEIPNSSSSENEDHYSPSNFKRWKSDKRPLLRNTHMRPPLRPAYKRRADQQFGGTPRKFPRRNGPFY